MPAIDFRVKTIFGNAFFGRSVKFADDVTVDTIERRRDEARKIFRPFDILAEFPLLVLFDREIDPALLRRFKEVSKKIKF